MSRYYRHTPPLLRNALLGMLSTVNHLETAKDRRDWVTVANLRTSLADWRDLARLRMAEAEADQ